MKKLPALLILCALLSCKEEPSRSIQRLGSNSSPSRLSLSYQDSVGTHDLYLIHDSVRDQDYLLVEEYRSVAIIRMER